MDIETLSRLVNSPGRFVNAGHTLKVHPLTKRPILDETTGEQAFENSDLSVDVDPPHPPLTPDQLSCLCNILATSKEAHTAFQNRVNLAASRAKPLPTEQSV